MKYIWQGMNLTCELQEGKKSASEWPHTTYVKNVQRSLGQAHVPIPAGLQKAAQRDSVTRFFITIFCSKDSTQAPCEQTKTVLRNLFSRRYSFRFSPLPGWSGTLFLQRALIFRKVTKLKKTKHRRNKKSNSRFLFVYNIIISYVKHF